ncbi:helix-turn-helix domain-containing protein [Cytobacillus sp. FSL K6-0129]|uniref:helix-turn-helix domain-containing protein n=1 Tax=Cytobacillus sp. FSL K6-0129 TaxID=2921421 RepID=UPI0030F59E05
MRNSTKLFFNQLAVKEIYMHEDIYVKFYKRAVTSGLVGALGSERFQTLCALAVFINDRGECFPSQDLLAQYLNVRRETVNRRVKALCDFRWNGHPIITKEQVKHPTKQTYYRVKYLIGLDAGFQFGNRELSDPCDVENNIRVTYM